MENERVLLYMAAFHTEKKRERTQRSAPDLLSQIEPVVAHQSHGHQPGGDELDGGAAEGLGAAVEVNLLLETGKAGQGQGGANTAAQGEDEGGSQAVAALGDQQGGAQGGRGVDGDAAFLGHAAQHTLDACGFGDVHNLFCLVKAAAFHQLDIDENRSDAENAGVESVPSFIIYRDGETVWKHSGEIDGEVLLSKVESFAN